jgi:hypothetical protein
MAIVTWRVWLMAYHYQSSFAARGQDSTGVSDQMVDQESSLAVLERLVEHG